MTFPMPFKYEYINTEEYTIENDMGLKLVITNPENTFEMFGNSEDDKQNYRKLYIYLQVPQDEPLLNFVDQLLNSLSIEDIKNYKRGLIYYVICLAKTIVMELNDEKLIAKLNADISYLIERNYSGLQYSCFPTLPIHIEKVA